MIRKISHQYQFSSDQTSLNILGHTSTLRRRRNWIATTLVLCFQITKKQCFAFIWLHFDYVPKKIHGNCLACAPKWLNLKVEHKSDILPGETEKKNCFWAPIFMKHDLNGMNEEEEEKRKRNKRAELCRYRQHTPFENFYSLLASAYNTF